MQINIQKELQQRSLMKWTWYVRQHTDIYSSSVYNDRRLGMTQMSFRDEWNNGRIPIPWNTSQIQLGSEHNLDQLQLGPLS